MPGLLARAARRLCDQAAAMRFAPPVAYVYNPLQYARQAHELYLERWGTGRKRTLFVGMNPGPWGMAQTGVPFGQVQAVRDWLGVEALVSRPPREHPARPVTGFACTRSEVSGQRLWGLFADRFGEPGRFFAAHFVTNYCPLLFLEASGRNLTPDRLPADQRDLLLDACDQHLRAVCAALAPRYVVGVGQFAFQRAVAALGDHGPQVVQILHPSPASPRANRDWAGQVTAQLVALGVWPSGRQQAPP